MFYKLLCVIHGVKNNIFDKVATCPQLISKLLVRNATSDWPQTFFVEHTIVLSMLNKNTWGVKKCGANQKQHCKQAGATKKFDIS